MTDSSSVFHIDMLDQAHRANFSDAAPWIFETDGDRKTFATEDEACAAQRGLRAAMGFDPMTGLHVATERGEPSPLLDLMKQLAPGFYTERDGGRWYIVTPDHDDRIGEEFRDRDDARRLMVWVAGGPMPEGWTITGTAGRNHCDLNMPGQYSPATLWTRAIREHFPKFAALPG